jgi:RHS repeat-associated protein
VFGPGIDEPLYHIDNLGRRTWLAADERGSIIATVPADGLVSWTNRYDEYGNYASRAFEFGFAGSYWHTPTGLYYMRARWYHPKLGRFLQTDPIGYGGGMNIYAYVKGDPLNFTDPLGLQEEPAPEENTIYVNGTPPARLSGGAGLWVPCEPALS